MKLTIVRFVIAGLIVAAVGFGIYYYFNIPEPALSTYNQISDLIASEDYTNFDSKLETMNASYVAGAAVNASFSVVETALTNNFDYYKSYLLFVTGVSQDDQTEINSQIQEYEDAFAETNRLLVYFNDNSGVSEAVKAQMHANFVSVYNAQIKIYVTLVETLKNYIIKYAFSNVLPVGLKQTLLQVQLDFAKVVIIQKLDIPTNPDTLMNELNSISTKYLAFLNEPQGTAGNILQFIDAYANFENIEEYFESLEKSVYVASYTAGLQADYVAIIDYFLNLASYN